MTGTSPLVDEAIVIVSELKKAVYTKNRNVRTDSTTPLCCRINTLSTLLSGFLQSTRDNTPVSVLAERFASISNMSHSLTKACPRRSIVESPLLILRNIKYILWNDKYLRPYEKEMENTSVFATALRPKMQSAYYILFILETKMNQLMPGFETVPASDSVKIRGITASANELPAICVEFDLGQFPPAISMRYLSHERETSD